MGIQRRSARSRLLLTPPRPQEPGEAPTGWKRVVGRAQELSTIFSVVALVFSGSAAVYAFVVSRVDDDYATDCAAGDATSCQLLGDRQLDHGQTAAAKIAYGRACDIETLAEDCDDCRMSLKGCWQFALMTVPIEEAARDRACPAGLLVDGAAPSQHPNEPIVVAQACQERLAWCDDFDAGACSDAERASFTALFCRGPRSEQPIRCKLPRGRVHSTSVLNP